MLSMSVQFDERISVSKILERNDVMSQTSLTPDHVHKYTNTKKSNTHKYRLYHSPLRCTINALGVVASRPTGGQCPQLPFFKGKAFVAGKQNN